MSALAKALSNVSNFVSHWAERLPDGKRYHRIYDGRDQVLADALKLLEAKSDSYYPAVLDLDEPLTSLSTTAPLTGLEISGTNFIGSMEKAAGSTASSTGEIDFEAVVPGEQTISISLEDDGGAITVTADATAGTIEVTHNGDSDDDIANAINGDAIAKYMVQATSGSAGAIDADETVTVECATADPGTVPVLQLGSISIDGSAADDGITAWTDTKITFDVDATGLTPGEVHFLRLWIDDVLVLNCPLVVDMGSISTSELADDAVTNAKLADDAVKESNISEGAVAPSKVNLRDYLVFCDEEFLLAASGTLPGPWAKDMQTVNITGDYLNDEAGGVYRILSDATSEAQAGQLTFGDQLVVDPTKNPIFSFRARIAPSGATFTADERLVMGLCSVHTNAEDGLDAVAEHVWFRIEGASMNILVEADDGTTDTDDQDSTIVLVKDTWTEFRIDMSDLSAIRMYVDGVEQGGAPLAAPLLSGNLQPIFCMQRDADAEVNYLDVDIAYGYADR